MGICMGNDSQKMERDVNPKALGFAGWGKPQLGRQRSFSLYTCQERQHQGGERANEVKNRS